MDNAIDGTRRDWKVLLIGGPSGVGKTIAAQHLARSLGISWAQADDFRLVLERETSPATHPGLHFFVATPDVWRLTPEKLRDGFIATGQSVSHALEIVVANHVVTNAPIVLEDDGLLPAMAAQRVFAGLDVGNSVRAVFIHEPDENFVFANMHKRGRGFHDREKAEQLVQTHAAWLYGQWLADEARRYRLPVLEPRPWETLVERILAVVGR